MRLGPGLALLAAAAVPLAVHLYAPPPPPEGGVAHVVILHTNDMHGQALPLRHRDGARGGFAALASAIERERAKVAMEGLAPPILVDAGDMWVGPPEGSRTKGRFVSTIMNRLGYAVAEVGNHEFDPGPKKLAELATWVDFPLLGANVLERATGHVPRWLRESFVVERDGVKVRFVGLLTSKIHEVTTPQATAGLDIEDETKTLRRVLGQRPFGDVTVLLTHCGHNVDKALAARFHHSIAAIVGGHTHVALDPAVRVPAGSEGATLVCQTGAKTQNLGRLDLEVDRRSGHVLRVTDRLIPLRSTDEDAAIKSLVADEVAACNKELGVRIGSITYDLRRANRSASNLGSLICDILREGSGADVTFTNPHGLRADIHAGPVLLRNIYEVDPFANTVITMRFTGAELRALLEEMCTVEPLESSGLELRYDGREPAGHRVVSVKVKGEPLADEHTYVIATNNFLAEGGDRYTWFKKGHERVDTGQPIRELVRRYFERVGDVPEPIYKNRVVDISR